MAIGALICFIAAVQFSGVMGELVDQDRLQQFVDSTGWLGPVAFVVLMVLLIPLGVPGLVLVLPAAAVFSAPVAIGVSLIGGYITSGVGLWFARTIGRDKVAEKLPPRVAAWNGHLARRGLLAVIVLRVVLYLAAPADWLLGLSRISTRDLALGTGLGLIPPTAAYVYAGAGLFSLLG